MPQGQRKWSGRLVRRGLVTAITVLAIAAFGLVTGGGQSLPLKPTASTAASTDGLSVASAVSPTNGSVNVAALGPNHSLRFYWQVGGTWYGPLGLAGSNTTYSAPSIVAEASGNMDILVEGPSNTLDVYWDASGTWYGPYQVGAPGSTFSTPSVIQEPDTGHLDVAVRGAGNSLSSFWDVTGTWYGPYQITGPNTMFGAPSAFDGDNSDYGPHDPAGYGSGLYIVFQGRNHDLEVEYYKPNAQHWEHGGGANDGTTYSSPSQAGGYAIFQGPNNSLWQSFTFNTAQYGQIVGAGTVFSAPSIAPTGVALAFQGPSHTLYYMYDENKDCCDGNYQGPLQIGAIGSSFGAPSVSYEWNPSDDYKEYPGTVDVLSQGPNNSLYAYWVIDGVTYGPVQVAGAGTTFSSSN